MWIYSAFEVLLCVSNKEDKIVENEKDEEDICGSLEEEKKEIMESNVTNAPLMMVMVR